MLCDATPLGPLLESGRQVRRAHTRVGTGVVGSVPCQIGCPLVGKQKGDRDESTLPPSLPA